MLAGQCLRIVKDAASVTIPLRGSRVTRGRGRARTRSGTGASAFCGTKMDGLWQMLLRFQSRVHCTRRMVEGEEVEDKEKETEVERRWGSARERPRGMIEDSSV